MANRKITVLNPSGYQEIFQSGDSLVVDGDINLQSNGLTGVPTPSADTDAANKLFVEDEVSAEATARTTADNTLQSNIDAEVSARTTADTTLQNQIDALTGGNLDTTYVNISGDNMTGNLTFDTDKITLNATGSATFQSNVSAGGAGTDYGLNGINDSNSSPWQASVTGRNLTSGGPVFSGLAYDFAGTNAGVTSQILEDGSATFSGALEAASIDGGTY